MEHAVITEIRDKLKQAGKAEWEQIAVYVRGKLPPAKRAFSARSLQKIAYGERRTLPLDRAQAIADYFNAKSFLTAPRP